MSFLQIWNTEKEKDRAGEGKVGDRPPKLNEKRTDGELELESDGQLQLEIKTKEALLLEEQHENFLAAGRK